MWYAVICIHRSSLIFVRLATSLHHHSHTHLGLRGLGTALLIRSTDTAEGHGRRRRCKWHGYSKMKQLARVRKNENCRCHQTLNLMLTWFKLWTGESQARRACERGTAWYLNHFLCSDHSHRLPSIWLSCRLFQTEEVLLSVLSDFETRLSLPGWVALKSEGKVSAWKI